MRKLFDTLTSTRTAAYLMAAVAVFVLLSAVVPQEGFETGRVKGSGALTEALQPAVRALYLDRIYESPLFFVLLALLSLGLMVGSFKRLGQLGRTGAPAARARQLGSISFHLALVVILSGVMLNRSLQFEGALGLTEGQQVSDDPAHYIQAASGSLRADRFGRFQLDLDSIDLQHPAGDATTEAAYLTVTRGPGAVVAQGPTAVNAPLRWKNLEFHIGSSVGYSPEIIFLDGAGQVMRRHFVRVGVHRTGRGAVVHEDYIDGPAAGQKLKIRIDPGAHGEAEPELVLAVLEGETVIHSGALAVGDTLRSGEFGVAVPRMRRWCYIQVVENPLVWLIFAGFWVGLIGLALSAMARVLPRTHERQKESPAREPMP